MKPKELTLIGIVSALQIVISLSLPLISLTTLIIFTLTLTMQQGITMAIVTAIITSIINGKVVGLINILLLPLTVFIIKKYQEKKISGCSRGDKGKRNFELAFLSFFVILIGNLISEIVASFLINGGVAYIIASIPIVFLGAFINAIIIGTIAIVVHYRICKIYVKIGF